MTRRSWILLFAGYFLVPASLRSEEPSRREKTATELVDESNQLLRGQSSHSDITMSITTPKWERTLRIEAWNHGRNQSLMRILSPQKERGNGTLKVDKQLWNWLPSVERVIKIPPSMMHSSWMGSDFTYEDVVKADSIVKDYTHRVIEKKQEGNATHYVVEAIPKPDAPVVWGKIILHALEDDQGILPLKEEDYSERGEHIRTLNFLEPKKMSGRRIPTKIECIPLKKPGNKTMIIYHVFELDVPFEPDFFSLRNLQKALR